MNRLSIFISVFLSKFTVYFELNCICIKLSAYSSFLVKSIGPIEGRASIAALTDCPLCPSLGEVEIGSALLPDCRAGSKSRLSPTAPVAESRWAGMAKNVLNAYRLVMKGRLVGGPGRPVHKITSACRPDLPSTRAGSPRLRQSERATLIARSSQRKQCSHH